VPLSNFITVQPVAQLSPIDRSEQKRYYDVRANVADGLTRTETLEDGTLREVPINANERITTITDWLEALTEQPLPAGRRMGMDRRPGRPGRKPGFLMKAFGGALGLMFIILLAQFNSFYNAVLVLLAVVLSTTGVLIGMLVMDQPFSIIMTGTGIVALAGIVVNNNIVLIDTYPGIHAALHAAGSRRSPAPPRRGSAPCPADHDHHHGGPDGPMMFGISLDFAAAATRSNSPTALWWKQLATAVVFGLGIATVLTLVLHARRSLALRVWRGVAALLGDAPGLQHHDPVGVDDGRQPVRDGDHRSPLPHRSSARLDLAFGLGVERARRLVEQQDRRVLQQRARDAHALLFAARQLQAPLAHHACRSPRQAAMKSWIFAAPSPRPRSRPGSRRGGHRRCCSGSCR
jgi:hypothetical protein